CSHSSFLTALPAAASSAFSRSVTSGMQPPQPVPALVVFLRSARLQVPARTALQICPLVTLLHEHTCAASDSVTLPLPSRAPNKSSSGDAGKLSPLRKSCVSVAYSAASPTRMPPSRRVRSALTTSFLYTPFTRSSYEMVRSPLASANGSPKL